ncbi:uncharacterized protein [Temnothorax longispinosus]|uniref:uncharacterized protein n=1 Tax=Temnothorax longispinosus TaxID=300112 RepID=UPI003A98D589
MHYDLIYRKQQSAALATYADSDWAGSKNRKSTTGFLLEVFGNNVSWTTWKQTTVALSSTEAEYVALASAAAELIWLKNLRNDLLITCETPVTLYEDNQSSIHLLNKWEHR